ncbi:hypothetical protein LINPERPRIM_LOCUS66 [Linum perenne]
MIQHPGALWVGLLKALYFPNDDFVTVPQHQRSSWIWASIIKGRDALLKGIRKNIGNRETTLLDEPWFPGSDDFRCHPRELSNCRVADCVIQSRRCWDLTKLRSLFPENMVKGICKIPIGPMSMSDRWVWHRDAKGRFSVKSCLLTP